MPHATPGPRIQHLNELLGRYLAQTEQEQAHAQQMATLAEAGEAAFDRAHCTPGHFTASGFVLSPDRTKLLLIYHSKLTRWLQPGGHIEQTDEDIVAAARREVSEETGLCDLMLLQDTPLDIDIHAIPARAGEPEHKHYDIRFAWVARNLALNAASDALHAKWVALREVSSFESDSSVMRAVEKLTASIGLSG